MATALPDRLPAEKPGRVAAPAAREERQRRALATETPRQAAVAAPWRTEEAMFRSMQGSELLLPATTKEQMQAGMALQTQVLPSAPGPERAGRPSQKENQQAAPHAQAQEQRVRRVREPTAPEVPS